MLRSVQNSFHGGGIGFSWSIASGSRRPERVGLGSYGRFTPLKHQIGVCFFVSNRSHRVKLFFSVYEISVCSCEMYRYSVIIYSFFVWISTSPVWDFVFVL